MRAGISKARAKQLTIRGVDPGLAETIDREAKRLGLSVNRLVRLLLRRALGLEPPESPKPIGHALDKFIGGWTEEEAAEFDGKLAEMRRIDPEMWT